MLTFANLRLTFVSSSRRDMSYQTQAAAGDCDAQWSRPHRRCWGADARWCGGSWAGCWLLAVAAPALAPRIFNGRRAGAGWRDRGMPAAAADVW